MELRRQKFGRKTTQRTADEKPTRKSNGEWAEPHKNTRKKGASYREPYHGNQKTYGTQNIAHTHTQQGTSPHVHTMQRYWIFSLDASVACQPMNAYATTARAAAATTFLGLHASDVQCTCATLNGSSRRRCLLPTRSMATSRWSASRARCWNLLLSGE